MAESGLSNALEGRKWPGSNAKVVKVLKNIDKRVVILDDGSTQKISVPEFMATAEEVINHRQKTNMAKSMRTNEDGTVDMTLGGAKQGNRKRYRNKPAAQAALKRKYGK